MFLVHTSPVDWGALRSVTASEHGARGGVLFLQLAGRHADAAANSAEHADRQACCIVGGHPCAHGGGVIVTENARCATVAPHIIELPRQVRAPRLARAPEGSVAEGHESDVAELQGRVLVMKPLYQGFAAAAQVRQSWCGHGGKVRRGEAFEIADKGLCRCVQSGW